jgi:hypothetical protein
MAEVVSTNIDDSITLKKNVRNANVRNTLPDGGAGRFTVEVGRRIMSPTLPIVVGLMKDGAEREVMGIEPFYDTAGEKTVGIGFPDDAGRYVGEVDSDGNKSGITGSGQGFITIYLGDERAILDGNKQPDKKVPIQINAFPPENPAGIRGGKIKEKKYGAKVRLGVSNKLNYGIDKEVDVRVTDNKGNTLIDRKRTINLPGTLNVGSPNRRDTTVKLEFDKKNNREYNIEIGPLSATIGKITPTFNVKLGDVNTNPAPGTRVVIPATVTNKTSKAGEARVGITGPGMAEGDVVTVPGDGSKTVEFDFKAGKDGENNTYEVAAESDSEKVTITPNKPRGAGAAPGPSNVPKSQKSSGSDKSGKSDPGKKKMPKRKPSSDPGKFGKSDPQPEKEPKGASQNTGPENIPRTSPSPSPGSVGEPDLQPIENTEFGPNQPGFGLNDKGRGGGGTSSDQAPPIDDSQKSEIKPMPGSNQDPKPADQLPSDPKSVGQPDPGPSPSEIKQRYEERQSTQPNRARTTSLPSTRQVQQSSSGINRTTLIAGAAGLAALGILIGNN